MKQENFKLGKYILTSNDSRWADADELKNASTISCINLETGDCPGAGIPIISDGRTVYVDNSDTHSIIFGATGSKKTRLFGMPLINILALAGESFITTDPKGELYSKTSGLVAAKGYKTIVLDFRNMKQSDQWNPLSMPYTLYHEGKTDEAVSSVNDFINALAEPQRKLTKDVYFIDLACAQALANMLFFIDTASPEEANIYNFANFFLAKCSVQDTVELSELVATGSIASINFKNILTNKEAERTFANVTSYVSTMLNPFVTSKTLCQVLSQSSFDVTCIGESKHAIYIIVPDEKTTLHFLVTAFVKQVYEALINEAQKRDDKMLPVRVNFVLDEFANIPAIPDMPSMISAARSRNMRFFLIVQSLFQLKQKYENDAHTIKGNCDNWVFLTSREYDLLDEISKLCGETLYMDFDGSVKSQPLISISELQRFKKEYGETLILHGRNYPFVTELPDIDEYRFKSYPPVVRSECQLLNMKHYDVSKVIGDIKDKRRPIPFSEEAYGREKFFESVTAKEKKNEVFDW